MRYILRMVRVMGIDASSSTIGLAILDAGKKIKLVHYEYYKPPKDKNVFEMLHEVKEYINTKIDEFNPDEVAIEDIIKFMANKSSAATTLLLAAVNRTAGLAAYEKMGKLPNMFSVMAIRHAIKLDKTLPTKEDIPGLIERRLRVKFKWIKVQNKRTKQHVAIKENYDMADAIAVALCFVIKNECK